VCDENGGENDTANLVYHGRAGLNEEGRMANEGMKEFLPEEQSRIELEFPQSIYDKEIVRSIRYSGTWDRLLL